MNGDVELCLEFTWCYIFKKDTGIGPFYTTLIFPLKKNQVNQFKSNEWLEIVQK